MNISGLTDVQVLESLEKYGSNSLTEQDAESFWGKWKGNFGDPMIKILIVALVINVIFAFLGQTKWYESVGIAVAVILATFVSTFSEYRNESAFQKLQEEASRIVCKVYRNGEIVEIAINDIVVGDYVLLQSGDKIPADGILVDGSVKVDQSVLNGEAKEAKKTVMPGSYIDEDISMDFLNPYKVFRGTVVVSGNAIMSVSVIGDKSVYGQIASELQDDEERDSPLKVKLSNLANGISKFGYIGGVAIAVALLFQRIVIVNDFDGAAITAYCSDWMVIAKDVVDAVMLAVIIIVMAVPEGLPLMIAIVSALNMGKMLKDNVLVRKVSGIETAGSLNILFSDKTGTITKGQLEAMVFVDGVGAEYKSYDAVVGELRKLLHLSIYHNTNAIINRSGKTLNIVGGNATERAILGFVAASGSSVDVATVNSIPFNSENKYSATTVSGDYNLTLIKGAPETILEYCKYYYNEKGEKTLLQDMSVLDSKIDELAGRAIRVLAIVSSENEIAEDQLPVDEWTLIGIIGIRDEVRAESIAAIAEVKSAGVQVVMITGDRKDTAVSIAKEAGLLENSSDLVLASSELAGMSDDDIKKVMKDIRVVARALPSDKSRLVRLAQDLNFVVGMTGDGVNDSPALKKADVGFSMGGGTEVAKEASDIVILDDNFSSIDKAILYGRTIFNSIRKFIIFQLTINVAAVLVCFISPLIGMDTPLTITQILWINLVMDTLAALAFGGEPALKRYMQEAPKRRDENIISKYMWSSILVGSLWTFGLSLVYLLTSIFTASFRGEASDKYVLTGYFALFVFISVFNAFNARTEKINIFDHIAENKGFARVLAVIVIVQLVLIYIGGAVFDCYGLSAAELLIVIGMSILIIPVDIVRKLVVGAVNRSK
jgi:calcium-translocating P-type ATPase